MEQAATDPAAATRRFLAYARERDEGALELLLADHVAAAHAQAMRLLGDRSDAEDAVQDALLVLVRTADRYDGTVPFAAWLARLVSSAAIGLHRTRRRRRRREAVGARPTTVDAVREDPQLESVRGAIAELPEPDRLAIELHYFAGLGAADVASALGVAESAIGMRLHRARGRLQERLRRRGLAFPALLAVSALCAAPAAAASSPAALVGRALRAGPRRWSTTGVAAIGVAAVVAVLGVVGAARPSPRSTPPPRRYAIALLTLGGPSAEARAINERGEIVGSASRDGAISGFLYRHGVMRELRPLAGQRLVGQALALNAAGQVVGSGHDEALRFAATTWRGDGSAVSLGFLPSATMRFSYALGINAAGEVVGFSARSDAEVRAGMRAFRWRDGRMSDLGTPDGRSSTANAINDRGDIVGRASVPAPDGAEARAAVLWRDGRMTTLPSGVEAADGEAFAINATGQIVGERLEHRTDGDIRHAVVWPDATAPQPRDLGTLGGGNSSGCGDNDAGDVVGWSEIADGRQHAFLWRDGAMRDLNDALPAGCGIELNVAYDIDGLGRIVGACSVAGAQQGFLLEPVADSAPGR